MNAAFTELRDAGVPIRRACRLIGRARATHYRHARGSQHGPREARAVPDNGQALSDTERQAVLTLINQAAYADLAIAQIWARELDEGRYLCSKSSMYRIAREAGQSRERRRLATHPAKVKPELLADGDSGHGNLPVGGQRISPLADTESPQGRSPGFPGWAVSLPVFAGGVGLARLDHECVETEGQREEQRGDHGHSGSV